MPDVRAELTQEAYDALLKLAKDRGIDANTALQQAISTEKLIADNMKPGDDLLIKRQDNSFAKFTFQK